MIEYTEATTVPIERLTEVIKLAPKTVPPVM
jgi:hypothetical protein